MWLFFINKDKGQRHTETRLTSSFFVFVFSYPANKNQISHIMSLVEATGELQILVLVYLLFLHCALIASVK